jgi:preprotein translocase subunit SecF
MRFFHNTNINFVGKRQLFFLISSAVIIIGLLATTILGIDYGIDFEGGTEIAVRFDKDVSTEEIRSKINAAGVEGAEIKSYGEDNQFLIRAKTTAEAAKVIRTTLTEGFKDYEVTILKEDIIGPKIGGELRTDMYIAVFLAVGAILIYIAFRFQFVYGLGAVVALVHDVVVTFSMLVIFHNLGIMNLELNQPILAGLLTVIGFSINDTVIIFDRIRENRDKTKSSINFIGMVNTSINETLSRTVNTMITVLIVLIPLVFMGGPVLQGFALTMLIGIITGIYSSIYIASSFVIWYLEKVKKVKMDSEINKEDKAVSPV